MKYKRIDEVALINKSSITSKMKFDFINYLDTGNITNGNIDTIQLLKNSKYPSRAKRLVEYNDVIYSTVRPNQCHYGIIKNLVPNMVVSTGFAVLSATEEIDADYLYYYLTLPGVVQELQNIAETSTSTYPSIKPSDIGNLQIPVPTIDIQKKIGIILSVITQKIETNNQINKNLQSISQLLFKHWFVDFEFPNEEGNPYRSSGGKMVESELGMIPKGWEIKTIKDITYNFDSKRKPLSSRQRERKKGIYPYYGATSIIDYIDEYIFDGIYVLLGEDGTVINSEGTPVLQYIWRKAWVNNHAHVLQGNGISSELLYLYLSSLNVSNIVTGAVQLKINQTNLNSVKVVYAKKQIIEQFDSLIQTIFATLRTLKDENECLSNLRDTLLPKLMNGEIDVSNIEMNN